VNNPLRDALSAAAISKINHADPQGVAALLDAGLQNKALTDFFALTIQWFIRELPSTTVGWWSAESTLFTNVNADTLGMCGTWQLLDEWKIYRAEGDFCSQSWMAAQATTMNTMQSAMPTWAYIDWDVGRELCPPNNCGVRLSLSVDRSKSEAWWACDSPLRAFQLAVNAAVDRAACAEFQLLSHLAKTLLVDTIKEASPKHMCHPSNGANTMKPQTDIRGEVRLFVSTTPCLSCLAAMRQFQLLFPSVSIAFACNGATSRVEETVLGVQDTMTFFPPWSKHVQ